MRHGGMASAWLRRGLVTAATVAVLATVGVLVGLPLLRDRSQHRLEQRADREVTAIAQQARTVLLADPAAGESTLRGAAATVDGVEVLAATDGGPGTDQGVRLVFRVRVTKTAASVFGWQEADVTGCFAQVVRPGLGSPALQRVPCPD